MKELKTCLRCGEDLEQGVVVGQMMYLNWVPSGDDGGPTMHGKTHLAKGSAWKGPRLDAARCPSCGLGYFEGQK